MRYGSHTEPCAVERSSFPAGGPWILFAIASVIYPIVARCFFSVAVVTMVIDIVPTGVRLKPVAALCVRPVGVAKEVRKDARIMPIGSAPIVSAGVKA